MYAKAADAYRTALPLKQAIAIVQAEAGKSFDPRVVEVLSRRYVELEELIAANQGHGFSKLPTVLDSERGQSPNAGFEAAAQESSSPDEAETSLGSSAQAYQLGQELYGAGLLGLAIGLAAFPADGHNSETLLAEAERRLYLSNQDHHAPPDGLSPGTLTRMNDIFADDSSHDAPVRNRPLASSALP